ncbi:MAG: PAS domain-containing protein [Alphaproteobacteria bacterium]|nr:PAS domain-containing protein [Alphaproteobacteria bacterium]
MNMSEPQQALLKHWARYHMEEGGLPSRNDFSLRALGKHVTHIVVMDVKPDPLDFQYRLVGTSVAEFLHRDYTGSTLSSLPGKGPKSTLWSFMKKTYEDGHPHYFKVPYTGPQEGRESVYTLYLPLASDHAHTDKIMLVPHFESRTAIIHVGLQVLH